MTKYIEEREMKNFTFRYVGGTKVGPIQGVDLLDAVRMGGINIQILDFYEVDGIKVQVAGVVNDGCVHSAEQGLPCNHDLQLAGLQVSDSDQREFDAGMEEFFDVLDDKLRDGKISYERAERFFPDEVRRRNRGGDSAS